jgi:hypothetical protein
MLYPELLAPFDMQTIMRDGRRLEHAEGASKPLQSGHPLKQVPIHMAVNMQSQALLNDPLRKRAIRRSL